MCVCAKSLQSCQTLCDPMDCSPPGSSVPGILQARILEWVAMPSSRGSSQPRDWTHVSCISSIGRRVLYHLCHLGSSFKVSDGMKLAREGMWTRRYLSISKTERMGCVPLPGTTCSWEIETNEKLWYQSLQLVSKCWLKASKTAQTCVWSNQTVFSKSLNESPALQNWRI